MKGDAASFIGNIPEFGHLPLSGGFLRAV